MLAGANEYTVNNASNLYSINKTDIEVDINFWNIYFDGSKYKERAGAHCVLIDPQQKCTLAAYRLEFECTNNTTEYEAFILGFKKAVEIKVKYFHVFDDSKIIGSQVRDSTHCNSSHLKNYQQ